MSDALMALLRVIRGRLGGGLQVGGHDCVCRDCERTDCERANQNPHPGPLPAYRARGKCAEGEMLSIANNILLIPLLAPLPVIRGRLGGGLAAGVQKL